MSLPALTWDDFQLPSIDVPSLPVPDQAASAGPTPGSRCRVHVSAELMLIRSPPSAACWWGTWMLSPWPSGRAAAMRSVAAPALNPPAAAIRSPVTAPQASS